ncbi:membrane protein [Geomonas silvestris]|uniref:Membrane protein n=1 Tax=Geomonas silvestris TaxID=2740184 RepID=A0A6V8MF47_9BACT|nr:DUF1003 domain-containing protein [Geomonas silvestris]GFO58621.1 membrane protein [Geomonas silvestris]
MDAEESRRAQTAGESEMASVVDRNIAALLARKKAEEKAKGWQERVADTITGFTGSMTFVYLHAVLFGLWIATNLGWLPEVPRFDPSFVVLAMAASVEAIFLSTFILISQNRMQAIADRRAELGLHVSLLAEHEVTRLIELVTAIADRMDLEQSRNPELQELVKDVKPEKVLDRMSEVEEKNVLPE